MSEEQSGSLSKPTEVESKIVDDNTNPPRATKKKRAETKKSKSKSQSPKTTSEGTDVKQQDSAVGKATNTEEKENPAPSKEKIQSSSSHNKMKEKHGKKRTKTTRGRTVLCFTVAPKTSSKKHKKQKRKKPSKRQAATAPTNIFQSTGEILEQVLTNPELFAEFEAFLKSEYAEENLQCYKAIWEYKKMENPSKKLKQAKRICDTFFGFDGQPELITITNEQREHFKKVLEDKSLLTTDLFDEVQGELGFILRTRWIRFSAANDGKN
jgi:hypothetical protein